MRKGATITRLRDGATAPAVPASVPMPPPPVLRPFCPPPPPAPMPLMRYPRTDNPFATKKEVKAGLDAVREEIKARFNKLKPVDEREPETCYQIVTRQNGLVENMNQLVENK